MLPLPTQPAQTAQAPQAAALAEAARAVEAARDALREEAKPSPEQLANLRAALEKALKTRSAALGRFHPGTLEAAGLWGAALHRTGEAERGDRIWARACAELHRGLRHQERFHGPDSKQLLPFLEALEACFLAQGLNARPFSERLLAIAIATTIKPSPDLERRAIDALTHHSGSEFLAMRGPDPDETMRWCEALADLWLRRPAGPEAARAFLDTAFRGDARGVWKLAATHGGAGLKAKVAALLDRVDAAILADDRGWPGSWARPLLQTPWNDLALTMLARVDRHLQARPDFEARLRRVDLAEAEGAWERGAALLVLALAETDAARFDRAAERSLDFLERHGDPGLLRALARAVAARSGAGMGDPALGRDLALGLEAEGEWKEAEALRRRMLRPGDAADLLRLARNLEGQERWEEAAALLETIAGTPSEDAPHADFERIRALRRAGREDEAARHAEAALRAWAAGPRPLPRRGFADALALVTRTSLPPNFLPAVLARLRKELGLPEDWPELGLPSLLAALEREEAARAGEARRGCDAGDPALGREARAHALLAAVAVREDPGREDCLDTALRLLDEAWDPQDPRLAPLLKRVAEARQESAPDRAEAALRRAVAILEAQRPAPAADLLELRVLLGAQLLQRGRRDAGERVLLDAFDRAAAGFAASPKEMDAAGGLFLALLQGFEADLRYDRALDFVRRAAAVADPVPDFPADARRDLAALLKTLERRAKLQTLLGAAWPEKD